MTDPNTEQQPIANTNDNDDTALNLFSTIVGPPQQKILGSAVVKPSPQDNSPIFSTSSCTGQMTEKDARIIYQILVESKSLISNTNTTATTTANFSSLYNLEEDETHKKESDNEKVEEALKKITISFASVQYSCCVDNKGIVYILKCATA